MKQLNVIKSSKPIMHANILDILFKHKNEIFRKLSDIRGLYFIDHVAITLINPNNEIIIFSITPSVEFNIIIQGLWEFDMSYNPSRYKEGKILFWENAYLNGYQNELKYQKETKHDFSLGFNLIRKINNFSLIYSFATRHNERNLTKYYQNLVNEFYSLGDYGYKQLRSIYAQYSGAYTTPFIEENKGSYLKLIINNK